ncbi:protein indeterminate-domain 7-like [Ipomoea triloba]|uniref:protein indeterminate-domain 7-like n=1 Tax=Ipomoea triloba TaxID=35885 RepID=UPI00125D381B|nr:protein indeterminate-domain 7-like [Ipomoea triloba]XP_031119732.1 protein indeterminate-domain 7-like [Ipomoea triloba]XP_031119733.1 protein indeterminate-domain 7-like [Ipomoea triloba]
MMKGVMIHQPNLQQSPALDNQENMSNVTSAASGEASVSSSNGGVYPHQQHYFGGNTINNQPQPQPQQIKKKRNQPGNPDPDSEVIALSPKTLMATNRFVCEICNKGFQRDQNLQLHRRGHNLPWKLKQRSSKDVVRKKVYVCPETSCVHHDPSRALGDLTGIKKHFCRKHGEKKWKCEKCSKRYAVQSDWKAHSKTCGTREYRCDCGTLFSRRDSFITHRAFCDALAEESARAINTGNNNAFHHLPQPRSSPAPLSNISLHFQPAPPQFAAPPSYSIKKEQTNAIAAGFNLRPEIPPWLLPCPTGGSPQPQQPPPPAAAIDFTPSIFQEFGGAGLAGFHSAVGSPHISATALLQKAAQMGATMSGGTGKTGAGGGGPTTLVMSGPHLAHVSSDQPANNNNNHHSNADFGLNLSSRGAGGLLLDGLASFGGKTTVSAAPPSASPAPSPSFLHDMMINSFSSNNTPFEDPLFGSFFNNKNPGDGVVAGDDITKDFLGLRPLSRSDIFNITTGGQLVNSPTDHHHNHHHQGGQSQKTWQQQA